MNKKQFIAVCLMLLLSDNNVTAKQSFVSHESSKENLIPSKFEYGGVYYKHDTSFNNFERIIKSEIDGEPKEETIVVFQTRCNEDLPQAFAFIYGKDYEFRIPLHNYPGELEAIDIDRDGKKELFFYSHGGAHYTMLFVYKYAGEKGLQKLFENGSACPVKFEFRNNIPTIKVGRANWVQKGWNYVSGEPLWEVYQWNGKEFQYKQKLSTTKPISEEEETLRYLKQATDTMNRK